MLRRRTLILGSLAAVAAPAAAQNSFLTPGGSSVPGIVTMCVTANVAAPCGGGPAFNPTTLFAGGQTGGWWDPSDLTSMFQDSAGTTPVTAAGQPVGRINDKSGNGNNLLQTTAGARPVLQIDTGHNYLACDGVTQWIGAIFTLAQPLTRVNALRIIAYITNARMIDGGSDGSVTFFMFGTAPNVSLYAGNGIDPQDATHFTVGSDHVGIELYTNVGSTSSLQIDNNAAVAGNPGPAAAGGNSVAGAGGVIGNIRFYGGIAIGRLLTTPEINNCRTFFGAKAGLTL
jgi:hypothetical protein